MKDLKQELEALSVSLNEMKESMSLSLNLMNSKIEEALKEAEVEPEKHKPTVRRIPFDIEKAEQGAKIVTREGKYARILCYDRMSDTYPIVALVLHPYEDKEGEGEEEIVTFTKDGRYYDCGDEYGNDLFIEEECV